MEHQDGRDRRRQARVVRVGLEREAQHTDAAAVDPTESGTDEIDERRRAGLVDVRDGVEQTHRHAVRAALGGQRRDVLRLTEAAVPAAGHQLVRDRRFDAVTRPRSLS